MLERTDPVNWSSLREMRISPKHYRHALTVDRPDTEAFQRGRVTHCAVYEPEQLAKRYVCEPRFHKGMNDETAVKKGYEGGKQAAAEWAELHSDAEIVPAELYKAAMEMADALRADPHAGPLIRGGFAEQLITWTDEATGIECRGRVDHVNGCLSDLKTSRTINPRQFAASAVRLGYHAQLAFYADGLAANGIYLQGPPCFIVVENAPPYDVAVLFCEAEDIAAGRKLYRECLDKLAECRATDIWPGVAPTPQRIQLPGWVMPDAQPLTMGGEPISL